VSARELCLLHSSRTGLTVSVPWNHPPQLSIFRTIFSFFQLQIRVEIISKNMLTARNSVPAPMFFFFEGATGLEQCMTGCPETGAQLA
jgi:hypothetical protein